MRPGSRWIVPLSAAVVVIGLDQLIKAVVIRTIGDGFGGSSWWLIPDRLGLSYVENRGAAFGTFVGYGVLLSLVALVVITGAAVIYARVVAPTVWLALGLGLVVGGALGNVVDRVRFGYVVDFVAVGTFPRFNVADSAITVGVLLLAWRLGWADEGARTDPAPATGTTPTTKPGPPTATSDGKDR